MSGEAVGLAIGKHGGSKRVGGGLNMLVQFGGEDGNGMDGERIDGEGWEEGSWEEGGVGGMVEGMTQDQDEDEVF